MIEPPTLVQYASATNVGPVTSMNVPITYQTGDCVLVLTGTGGTTVSSVSDTGGSTFKVITDGASIYWKLWYSVSAIGSTSVTVNFASGTAGSVIVAILRGVSAVGATLMQTGLSGATIPISVPIAAGSRLVGMLGVAFNGAGNVTLSGDASGKTTHGDLRLQIGNGHDGRALIGLIDTDGLATIGSTPTLQVTPSLASNWLAIAIELIGTDAGNPVYTDQYIIGDIIDSDGLIRSAVTFTPGGGVSISARKGSFPCIPQNGGAPVVQTYAAGFISSRFSFTFGTVEVKAKLGGVGYHNIPIFMLGVPSKPWANDGSGPNPANELDVAESGINNANTTTYREFANPPTHTVDITPGFDPTADFHIYKLVWTPTSVTWYTDGVQVDQITTNIPQTPMYILCGGYMGEFAITDSLLPTFLTLQYMNVTDANGKPVSNSGNVNVLPAPFTGGSGGGAIGALIAALAASQ